MAQNHRKYVREGNREYSKAKYDQSEIEYRRAIDVKPDAGKAVFNLGDALYRMGKYDEAGEEFSRHTELTSPGNSKAASEFNRGNALLKAGKLEESIEAYKSSLLVNPSSHEAKYNLAYAQDLLKQQQQQEQDKQNQDKKDQDNQDDKEKQDQQQNEDQQDQDQNQDDKQQQQNQDQQQDSQDQKKEESTSPKMTQEDAERLLQALANEEKDVQEKVKKEKAAAARVRVLKNW